MMTVQGPVVRWIQDQVATQPAQIAVTVGIVLGVAAVVYVVNRLSDRFREAYDATIVETVQTLLLGIVMATAVIGTLVVWRAADDVATALAVLDLGIGRLLATVSVILSAYVLTRLTKRFIKGFATDTAAFSSHQREIVHHIIQVTVFLFAILVVLSLWQVNLGNLLLGAGVLGVVLGLAARQTLGAVLAGFVVLFSRPFKVGDWIEVEDVEGVVRDINIVNTRIRTVDGETVMIPNDTITGTLIRNKSRRGRLRIQVEVGVDFNSDLDAAMDLATDAMADIDIVQETPEPHVILEEFGDSAIVLALRFWIDDPSAKRYWRARSAVVRSVKSAYDEADLTIPFPQRTISARPDIEELPHLDDDGAESAAEDEHSAEADGHD